MVKDEPDGEGKTPLAGPRRVADHPAILPTEFYDRPTLEVSRDLLGKFLVRRWEDGREIALAISEVEAYDGLDDRASHARRGVTPRTAVMFGPPGFFYVYLCYGMHWLLNVVTGPEGYPAAVLIRGAGNRSGPARLTKFLGVDGSLDKKEATSGMHLWIEDRGLSPQETDISRTPRIGVAYAGAEWATKPYRYLWNGGLDEVGGRGSHRETARPARGEREKGVAGK